MPSPDLRVVDDPAINFNRLWTTLEDCLDDIGESSSNDDNVSEHTVVVGGAEMGIRVFQPDMDSGVPLIALSKGRADIFQALVKTIERAGVITKHAC